MELKAVRRRIPMVLHHVGIAVENIEKYYYEILNPFFGFHTISDTIVNTSQNIKVAFAKNSKSMKIELIEAVDDDSPTVNIIKR
ncbi:MAG: VOC family protein, partial [Tannerella sp.]|nr:VOC family protein [Tannerella sp.]